MIDLGFCPRCKEDLEGMMTRVVWDIKWCWLCSFDLEEATSMERSQHINWAKAYAIDQSVDGDDFNDG